MRLFPRYVSEHTVRREVERHGGSYRVDLTGMDRAWNPQPESAYERATSLRAAPFSGPFTVIYERDAQGHITASLDRR